MREAKNVDISWRTSHGAIGELVIRRACPGRKLPKRLELCMDRCFKQAFGEIWIGGRMYAERLKIYQPKVARAGCLWDSSDANGG